MSAPDRDSLPEALVGNEGKPDPADEILKTWIETVPEGLDRPSLLRFGRAAIRQFDAIGWDFTKERSRIPGGKGSAEYLDAFQGAIEAGNPIGAISMTELVALKAVVIRRELAEIQDMISLRAQFMKFVGGEKS